MILSSAWVATSAILNIGGQCCVGAFCAHLGILTPEFLRASSKLFMGVMIPLLAFSYLRVYSPAILLTYIGVLFAGGFHVIFGMALGMALGKLLCVPSNLAPALTLCTAVSNAVAFPLIMVPQVANNWKYLEHYPGDVSTTLAAVTGMYLTGYLFVFFTAIKGFARSLRPKATTAAAVAGGGSRTRSPQVAPYDIGTKQVSTTRPRSAAHIAARAFAAVDPVIRASALAIIIACIPPLRGQFLGSESLSWLSTAAKSVGSLCGTWSLLILGGVLFNTRKGKVKAQVLRQLRTELQRALRSIEDGLIDPVQSTMHRLASLGLPKGQLQRMRHVFSAHDVIKTARLSVAELRSFLLPHPHHESAASEMASLIELYELHADADGTVSVEEFVNVASASGRGGKHGEMSDEEIEALFNRLDVDGNGALHHREIAALLGNKGADALLADDGDRMLTLDEFTAKLSPGTTTGGEGDGTSGSSANKRGALRRAGSFVNHPGGSMDELLQQLGSGLKIAAIDTRVVAARVQHSILHTMATAFGDGNTILSIARQPSWSAVTTGMSISRSGGATQPQYNPRLLMVWCLLARLIIAPAILCSLHLFLARYGVLPKDPIVLLTLNIASAAPAGPGVVAVLLSEGCTEPAALCSSMMIQMYVSALPTLIVVVILSAALIPSVAPLMHEAEGVYFDNLTAVANLTGA